MRAYGFRSRPDRLDEILVAAAERRNPNAYSLERALNEPGLSFFDLFPGYDWMPRHYGKVAKSMWRLVDDIYKPADNPAFCPPGLESKSVVVADIYERPLANEGTTNAFLGLWVNIDEPVLVPCPTIPDPLLQPEGTTGADTRQALGDLIQEIAERLNLILPAAMALGAARHS